MTIFRGYRDDVSKVLGWHVRAIYQSLVKDLQVPKLSRNLCMLRLVMMKEAALVSGGMRNPTGSVGTLERSWSVEGTTPFSATAKRRQAPWPSPTYGAVRTTFRSLSSPFGIGGDLQACFIQEQEGNLLTYQTLSCDSTPCLTIPSSPSRYMAD